MPAARHCHVIRRRTSSIGGRRGRRLAKTQRKGAGPCFRATPIRQCVLPTEKWTSPRDFAVLSLLMEWLWRRKKGNWPAWLAPGDASADTSQIAAMGVEHLSTTPIARALGRATQYTVQLSGGVARGAGVARSFCFPSPALPLARSARWGGSFGAFQELDIWITSRFATGTADSDALPACSRTTTKATRGLSAGA